MQARLFGRDVMISRTGYTGERGYEIFCRGKDAVHLWDSILETGGDDVRPVQFSPSICCGLKAICCSIPATTPRPSRSRMQPCGDTLWELGLDFTVSPDKIGFIGCREPLCLRGQRALQDLRRATGDQHGTDGHGRACMHADGKDVGVSLMACRPS